MNDEKGGMRERESGSEKKGNFKKLKLLLI